MTPSTSKASSRTPKAIHLGERNVSHVTRAVRYDNYMEQVAKIKGPSPICIFKQLRTKANISLMEFSRLTGTSKQAIIRQEQGTYTDPIDRIVDYVLSNLSIFNSDLSRPELLNQYYEFQKLTRQRHTRLFGTEIFKELEDCTRHPFELLMERWCYPYSSGISPNTYVGSSLNPTEVAKLLCVSQSVLDHWLGKPKHQQAVPNKVVEALRDNGYYKDEIEALQKSYYYWRLALVGSSPVGLRKDSPVLKKTEIETPVEPKKSMKDLIMEEVFSEDVELFSEGVEW